MIDPRNHQNRRLQLKEPRITAARNAYWTCFVCNIHNHISRDRCHKCGRPRLQAMAR